MKLFFSCFDFLLLFVSSHVYFCFVFFRFVLKNTNREIWLFFFVCWIFFFFFFLKKREKEIEIWFFRFPIFCCLFFC